jgi:hypothetical protein
MLPTTKKRRRERILVVRMIRETLKLKRMLLTTIDLKIRILFPFHKYQKPKSTSILSKISMSSFRKCSKRN